jgi:hypothetical protein
LWNFVFSIFLTSKNNNKIKDIKRGKKIHIISGLNMIVFLILVNTYLFRLF